MRLRIEFWLQRYSSCYLFLYPLNMETKCCLGIYVAEQIIRNRLPGPYYVLMLPQCHPELPHHVSLLLLAWRSLHDMLRGK
jgi:hypothetical protein